MGPSPGARGPGVGDMRQHGDPHGGVWRPGETDVSIRPGWFNHPAEDDKVKSVDDLVELYFTSVGRNSKLLLNVPPTRGGLLYATDVARLAAMRARLQRHVRGCSARASARLAPRFGLRVVPAAGRRTPASDHPPGAHHHAPHARIGSRESDQRPGQRQCLSHVTEVGRVGRTARRIRTRRHPSCRAGALRFHRVGLPCAAGSDLRVRA